MIYVPAGYLYSAPDTGVCRATIFLVREILVSQIVVANNAQDKEENNRRLTHILASWLPGPVNGMAVSDSHADGYGSEGHCARLPRIREDGRHQNANCRGAIPGISTIQQC